MNVRAWVCFLLAFTGLLIGCEEVESTAVLPTVTHLYSATPDPVTTTIVVPTRTETAVSRPTAANTAAIPPTAIEPTLIPTPTVHPTNTATATHWPAPDSILDVEGASVPPGFSFLKFADVYRPTSLTFDAQGRLFMTSFDGTVRVLWDTDGDGRSDQTAVFADGFIVPLGITIYPQNGDVYVSSNGKITILRDTDGDLQADEQIDWVTGLPVGLHQNDNLKFGPDGMLYMGLGSTCDACAEADPRSGTIMRFDPNTGVGEVFATGLRNPYDLAFHPVTGDLFATDNGRDDLGLDAPAEELNHIRPGLNYGWPGCWDNTQGPDCADTETAVAFFEPHSSANSLVFYGGDRFPPPYQQSAYVTIFGSWLKQGVETGVAQVNLQMVGDSFQGTVRWLAQWPGGMPLGLIEGPDGALYVGDYINDAIYRISYGP